MAVNAIEPASGSSSASRTELYRAQQKLTADLAEKAAEKVAAADKAAVTVSDTEILKERQKMSGTLDLVV